MKKTLLTLALVATSVAAFAQGKVTFGANTERLFVIGEARPGDTGGGGASGNVGAIPTSPLPSGVTLVAGLYAGTSSSTMTLQASTVLSGTGFLAAGRPANVPVTMASIPGGGSPVFFQIAVWDNAFVTPQQSALASYFGATPIFTAVPGTSTAAILYNAAAPVNSTWAPGNIVINAAPIPEPSTLALAGLGAASLLIFRRRK